MSKGKGSLSRAKGASIAPYCDFQIYVKNMQWPSPPISSLFGATITIIYGA